MAERPPKTEKRRARAGTKERPSKRASDRKRRPKKEGSRRAAAAIRTAITSALFQDHELMEEITEERVPKKGPKGAPKLLRAVDALEPMLAEAVKKHPSFLGRLAYGTAQLVSTLASEDEASSRRLGELAKGSHVGIVFVDVVGFTAFTSSNGDDAAVVLVRRVEALVVDVCRRFQGEIVKHLGDGFLLAFGSASRAVRAGLALRDTAREERKRDPSFQEVRIAVHAGRPSIVGDDLIGHDVNLTARVLEYCEPGEVLVTEDVKRLAEKRLKSVVFTDERRVAPRGLPDAVTTFQVRRSEDASS